MAQSTKIMLVEDDNNLGEIYMARMAAEGYAVVVAHDGEEALALAAKEKPDLIISDVMMPKISGFEMLDILRNTPGLRDTKVIMLTALGQAEDKTRAQSLGADRYLVKSQVTLEDIVENARALLSGESVAVAAAVPTATQPAAVQPAPTPAAAPATQTPTPTQTIAPTASAPEPIPVAAPAGATQVADPPKPADPPAPIAVAPEPAVTSAGSLAQPLNASPASTTEPPKTAPIADVVAASEAVQPAPAAPESPPVPPAVQAPAPAPQPADPPSAPQLPQNNAAVSESNDKVLTGAVDELLANAPKAAAPAPAAATAAPSAAPGNAPSEHTSKVLDDGGNELDTGNTESSRVSGKKVIAPISGVAKKPDLNALLANEEAKAAGSEALPGAPGITTSTNGVQTTVVMPSGSNISDVSAPTTIGAPTAPANLQEPPTPGQNNPNVTNPASANAPGANFDPSSVAL
ncbi:MAG TPA: response regulator [Candidatus Saccharimonadales bacterium]|nr:response regulator [Candidatus Saccharimonadales bacterium]